MIGFSQTLKSFQKRLHSMHDQNDLSRVTATYLLKKVFKIVNSHTYLPTFLFFKCSIWLQKNRVKTEVSREILQIPVTGTRILDRNDKTFFPSSKVWKYPSKNKCWKYRRKNYFTKKQILFWKMPAFSATLQFIKHAFEFFVYLSEDQSKLGANFFLKLG